MISQIPNLEFNTLHQSLAFQDETKQIQLQNKSQKSRNSGKRLTEKPSHTIQVLSDQEEEQIISEKFQQEVFRAKIEEAKLTKSKNTVLKVLYVELNFRNKKEHEKENRFNSMVRMYVSKNLKTSQGEPFDLRSSYFFNQMVPKSGEDFVQNEYLLYGCDLLSQRHIEKMFHFYSPSIKWIDASHCRLTFMSKAQGWDAVINNCLEFEYLKRYILENQKVEQLMDKLELQADKQMEEQYESKYTEEYFKLQKFKKEYHVLKEFIELMPYYELGFKRRLFIRNVTSSQQLIGYDLNGENKSVKSQGSNKVPAEEIKKPESQYKKYLRVKDSLWREIQNSPLVKPEYEKIQKQILRQKELLWNGKRPSTHQNKSPVRQHQKYNQINQNSYQRSEYNNSYPQRSFNESYSQRNNYYPQQNELRNRSRDQYFQERHYPREGQPYRGKNFNGQHHNKYVYRNDKLERAFENYIEQRNEVNIIENPHKYLQPEFVDKKTGLHFYRNPFYNPPIQAQLSYPNYNYEQQAGEYQPSPAYDYGSQTINNTNLSGYEYDGNIVPPQNLNPSHYDSKQTNLQVGIPKKHHHQRTNSKHSVNSNKKSVSTEEMFNNYCAQRNNSNPQQQMIIKKHQKNQKSHTNQLPSIPNQLIFEVNDFSIITEEKSQTQKGSEQIILDHNLENILDQIHQDEHSINLGQTHQLQMQDNQKGHVSVYQNDDDSQDLEFMLRQRQAFHIKSEVKQEHDMRKSSNSNHKGFIEQKIKEENIPNWFKSNLVVDDFGQSQKVSNVAVNSQRGSQIQLNFDEVVCAYPEKTSSEVVQNMKKKINLKKSRDSSSSRSKKSGQSLTKKNKN